MARKTVRYTIDKVPAKLRWRPRVSGWGIFFGAIGGLGAVVLLQQAGLRVLTRALSIQGLSGAIVSGIIVPSLVYMISVGAYNRRLRRYLNGSAGRAMAATTAVAVLAVSTAALLVFSASPAHATVTGQCRVTLNGVDVAPLQPTAADAILVDAEGTLTGTLEFPSEIDGGSIDVMYAGFSAFTFQQWDDVLNDEDAIDTGPGVESRTVETSVVSRYAAGVYDVFGAVVFENGDSCEVAFAFKIDTPPLETPVGQAAAGAAAFGALGGLGVLISRTREGAALLAGLDDHIRSLPTPDPLDESVPEVPTVDHGPVPEFPGAYPTELDHGPSTEFPVAEPTSVNTDSGADTSDAAPEVLEREVAPPPDLSFDDLAPDVVPGLQAAPDTVAPVDAPAESAVPPTPVPTPSPQDFLGRDTVNTVASTATAVQQAGESLDTLARDVGVPDEIRERVRERIKPAADRLESIRETAERARDTVDWARDIGDDTQRRLAGLGVPQGLRDGIVWLRGMFGWVGGIAQDAATNYLGPITRPIGRMLGMEPDKVAGELFPIGEFGTQLGDMVVTGAENIKGGANYGGQLSEIAGDIPGDAGNTGLDEIMGPNRWGR